MLSTAARRINDRVVIELAIDDISSASDQRQVGEPVKCRLWTSAGYRTGTEDLCQYCRVGSLLVGVDFNLVNYEINILSRIYNMDDDQVPWTEIL